MKKQTLITAILLVITALTTITLDTNAQNSNEFTVPLSDPAKRGKLKAHINYGSISVKGTARKDILVRYKSEDDDDEEDSKDKSKNGLKRIGSGGIDFEVAESDNNVKVSSNSWNKTISNIQGETVLTNYNGEITAINISGSVIATTYNGDIKVLFDKVTAGTPMSYSTYNGDIDIALPPTHKASLKMKTEQGDIYSDFDVAFKNTGPVQQKKTDAGVYKVIVDEWKRGDINGGGPELTIKNYNGDIFIRKK